MADKNKLKIADHDNDQDDPFAELTKIMGFDPRLPVKRSEAEALQKLSAPAQVEDDFDIDLERELLGEFALENEPVAQAAESRPVEASFEATGPAPSDLVEAGGNTETALAVEAEDGAAPEADEDFSFDPVPFDASEFALRTDEESESLASSRREEDMPAQPQDVPHNDLPAEASGADREAHPEEAGSEGADLADQEADLNAAFARSMDEDLDDDWELEAIEPENTEPVPVAARQSDLDSGFDAAMAEVDMDFSAVEQPESRAAEDAVEPAAEEIVDEEDLSVEQDAVEQDADDEAPILMASEMPMDSEEGPIATEEDPIATEEEPVTSEEEPVTSASEDVQNEVLPEHVETSLEDELNALLGKMVKAQPVFVPANQPVEAASDEELSDDFDRQPDTTQREVEADAEEPASVVAAADEQDDFEEDAALADGSEPDGRYEAAAESDDQDWERDPEPVSAKVEAPTEVQADEPAFNDEAFAATFAEGVDDLLPEEDSSRFEDEDPRAEAAPRAAEPAELDEPDPFEALRRMAGSWRSARPASANSDEPPRPAAAFAANEPAQAYEQEDEPVAVYEPEDEPEEADAQPPTAYEEVPDIETVDVPESAVALADDLDLPDVLFEEDPPPPAYDDLDAEFASLLSEMNNPEPMPAPASAPQPRESWLDRSRERSVASTYAYPVAASAAVATGAAYASAAPARPAQRAQETEAGELDLNFDDQAFDAAMAAHHDTEALPPLPDYDPDLEQEMSIPDASPVAEAPSRRGLWIAALVGGVAIAGGVGAFALSYGDRTGVDAPALVKADSSPIKIRPENPGGAVVPNQDNKVYESVGNKGPATAGSGQPKQEKLVTTTEEPVDVATAETDAPETPVGFSSEEDGAAPAMAKGEDRIEQVIGEAESAAAAEEVPAVQPRKVRTMVVKPDGSLVPADMPTPEPSTDAPMGADAAPLEPAQPTAEPSEQSVASVPEVPPAVAPSEEPVAPIADPAAETNASASTPAAAAPEAVAPAAAAPVEAAPVAQTAPVAEVPAKPRAKSQSSTTPNQVALAPARPADQPLDIVGEVKPDRVAAIDTQPTATATTSGAWSMQIASQPSQESAQSTYKDLARRYGGVLNGRSVNIVKAEIPGKGTFWRVRVPAQSRNDAVNLCNDYKAAGGNCFVSK